ncbi:MAG: SOS response-associated peptidase [Clostridiales bacterium]|nr:SOS response-associated peptidase [Clostridiales bacterium]
MCNRYYIAEADSEADEDLLRAIEEINRRYQGQAVRRGEIRPTDVAPVIALDGPQPMRWGFVFSGGGNPGTNARRETAATRPAFARPLRERRLAVPTSGFFEWSHENGRAKDKYLFRLRGQSTLYLAGLWDLFARPDGWLERRFAILTTGANEGMRRYHDRMPVYLGRGEVERWLADAACVPAILERAQPELVAAPAGPPPPEQLTMF